MRGLTPGDRMSSSAKRAIDTALTDASRQRVGTTSPTPTAPAAAPTGRPAASDAPASPLDRA